MLQRLPRSSQERWSSGTPATSSAQKATHTTNTAGAAQIASGLGPELREQAQELVDRARDQGFPLLLEVIEDE